MPEGYRGVQEKPLPPATYYINPYVEAIVPVDVRSHPVEFADIEFPSRDGFTIQPHVLVSYKVIPEKAPELFVMLCDERRAAPGGRDAGGPEEEPDPPEVRPAADPRLRPHRGQQATTPATTSASKTRREGRRRRSTRASGCRRS